MDAAHMLAHIPLFEDLTSEDIHVLAEQMKLQKLHKGQAVFRKGEPGDSMFIVAEGVVSIYLPAAEGDPKVVLKDCHVGQYFGELALFDDKPRSASAEATADCELLELEREALHEQMRKRPRIALTVLHELAERLRETNAMLSHTAAKDVNKEIDEKKTFGDRIADRVAEVAGSWAFILSFIGVLFCWMILNGVAISRVVIGREPFDPFPFIFFNLLLSIVAAFQGPVIMMSQNRQSLKDRAQAETDFKVNLKNELGIENLQRGMQELRAHLVLLEKSTQSLARRDGAPPSARTGASEPS